MSLDAGLSRMIPVRRPISMPVSLEDRKPKWNDAQKYDLLHLSNRDISDHIIRMGIRVLELNTMEDSIKGWAQEVKKKKVAQCLKEPHFVRRLVKKMAQEDISTPLVVELAKALVSLDYASERRLGKTITLEILFEEAIVKADPEDLDPCSIYRINKDDDPRYLASQTLHFLLHELDSICVGASSHPSFMKQNIAVLFAQVCRYVNLAHFPRCEVAPLMDQLQHSLEVWTSAASSVLVHPESHMGDCLGVVHLLIRRGLEIQPEMVQWQRYAEMRTLLQRLQKRVMIFKGQWLHLASVAMQSALPSPPPPPALPTPGTHALRFSLDQAKGLVQESKLTPCPRRGRAHAECLPASETMPPGGVGGSCGHLSGWIKTPHGRMRPWSAQLHRPPPTPTNPVPTGRYGPANSPPVPPPARPASAQPSSRIRAVRTAQATGSNRPLSPPSKLHLRRSAGACPVDPIEVEGQMADHKRCVMGFASHLIDEAGYAKLSRLFVRRQTGEAIAVVEEGGAPAPQREHSALRWEASCLSATSSQELMAYDSQKLLNTLTKKGKVKLIKPATAARASAVSASSPGLTPESAYRRGARGVRHFKQTIGSALRVQSKNKSRKEEELRRRDRAARVIQAAFRAKRMRRYMQMVTGKQFLNAKKAKARRESQDGHVLSPMEREILKQYAWQEKYHTFQQDLKYMQSLLGPLEYNEVLHEETPSQPPSPPPELDSSGQRRGSYANTTLKLFKDNGTA